MARLFLSAAHKSSGKTTVTLGLGAALAARGLRVQPFKKGPDYIDPMWLGLACGRPCRNLDFNVMARDEVLALFVRHAAQSEIALVEGNKGLYDGLDLDGSNSNAALAKLLRAPVVLVLDARGMTRGIAPLILGYQAFDREVNIAGVILNQLGGSRHEAKLRAVIEHYTEVPVLGAVHRDPRLEIGERHLGLVPSNEAGDAAQRVARFAERIAAQADLDRLLELARSAPPLVVPAEAPRAVPAGPKLRIAIARDRAFGFYYADDLEALVAAGAELLPFDTLRDAHLPQADALVLGGGFPEMFLGELEANASLRAEVRAAIEGGMPAYAECGGLMYLARSLSWRGCSAAMAGVIPGDVVMHERPMGRGYVRLEPSAAHPWPPAGPVRAHEFHYSSLEGLPPETRYAWRVKRGHGLDGVNDGIVHRNLLASYSHLRSVAGDDWAARFVAFARRVRDGAGVAVAA